MALLPQNPRNRNLLLISLLSLGLAAVYQQLVWTPKNQELTVLAAHLDTLDSLNRIAKREVARGTTDKMNAEAAAYGRELDVLHRLVPTQNEVPALLESVSNAARRAGLELTDVHPDGVENGDRMDTYRYKLGVQGPYHKVADFLANIGSLPRIIAPINVILTNTSRIGDIKPAKDEQMLDVKFQVQTYVSHSGVIAPVANLKAGAP